MHEFVSPGPLDGLDFEVGLGEGATRSDVDACDHVCPRESTRNTKQQCLDYSYRTYMMSAHFIVGRPFPGLNYQCHVAKHISRFY